MGNGLKMILMCKNIPVYDIETEEVYNKNLLPGYMQKDPCRQTFKNWFKLRYSSNTNSLARKLKGVTFGQGNRVLIDTQTMALSLSDCYWIKDAENKILFEEVSPYYNDFWKGEGFYKGGAVPTLYVSGYLTKEWVSAKYLNKYGDLSIESEICRLCRICDIAVCGIDVIDGGIRTENFTTPEIMLEQADESGRIDPDDFDENDIIELFGITGVQMIVIDAIIGNGDRHAGNFGWLRNADTGEYISQAPLYDFDHALDTKQPCDRLIEDAVKAVKKFGFQSELLKICNMICSADTNDIFKIRANTMKKLCTGGEI